MSKLGPLYITKHSGAKHTGTVIFFHGSGATGDHMKEWVNIMVKDFSFPQIKVIYPTAPLQPYTPAGGELSHVWFDRTKISQYAPEMKNSINKIEVEIRRLIKTEIESGIPSKRIIVGGFSMGGALALHTAYRWDRNLAGTFAFSSFLNEKSLVYKNLVKSPMTNLPPLLQLHGNKDELVNLDWGQNTYNELRWYGVDAEFHQLDSLGHSINKKGMLIIKEWIEKILPDI